MFSQFNCLLLIRQQKARSSVGHTPILRLYQVAEEQATRKLFNVLREGKACGKVLLSAWLAFLQLDTARSIL